MKLAVPRLTYDPPLPLAMYYELAAHLSQIPAFKPKLIRWQDLDQSESIQFDYHQSQIAALQLEFDLDLLEDLVVYMEHLPCLSADLSMEVSVQHTPVDQAFISSLLPLDYLKATPRLTQALGYLLGEILGLYGCWRSW